DEDHPGRPRLRRRARGGHRGGHPGGDAGEGRGVQGGRRRTLPAHLSATTCRVPQDRSRTAANSAMPAATEALRLAAAPGIRIAANTATAERTPRRRPPPPLPPTGQTGRSQSWAHTVVPSRPPSPPPPSSPTTQ